MNYILYFILAVTALSTSELFLLVYVASKTSFMTTLLLCMLTGLVGGTLIRWQGLETLRRLQRETQEGRMPTNEIIGGILLIIMGVLLCVPGFITDTLGFLIIVPGIRNLVVKQIRKRIEGMAKNRTILFNVGTPFTFRTRDPRGNGRQQVVDADFTVEDGSTDHQDNREE